MELDLDASEVDALSATPIRAVDFNISALFEVSDDVTALSDPVYEQFLADVWVGIVLTLMVLSCVCFMCACLIYHKFQEWKNRVVDTRSPSNLEAGLPEVELPSYTIASGLPTYQEALEQLKKVKELQSQSIPPTTTTAKTKTSVPESNECWRQEPVSVHNTSNDNALSVFHLFGIYNRTGESGMAKPS